MTSQVSRQIPADEITIEPFNRSEINLIMEIEERSFTAPWARQSYLDISEMESMHFYVAKHKGELVGYLVFQTTHTKDIIELHTIATAPELRGCGISKLLMNFMLDFARQDETKHIFLLVRPSNRAAILLYEKYGFRTIGLRPHYYVDNKEDALIMRLDLKP